MRPLLGIQLYTVRDRCATDFKGTVTALAEMGYQGVELAWNYGGMSPDALAEFLASLNLRAAGLHVSLAEILNPNSDAYRYVMELKSAYLTTSLAGEVAKDWRNTIAAVQRAGEVAREQGVIFTYHHHAEEFAVIDGEYALDLLFAGTDATAVAGELDTFWMLKGSVDPLSYLRKYAGRVPQLHLKDMDPITRGATEVGCGLLDVPAVFATAADAGVRWVIVEQDICAGSSLDSARASLAYLHRTGLFTV